MQGLLLAVGEGDFRFTSDRVSAALGAHHTFAKTYEVTGRRARTASVVIEVGKGAELCQVVVLRSGSGVRIPFFADDDVAAAVISQLCALTGTEGAGLTLLEWGEQPLNVTSSTTKGELIGLRGS